MSNNPTARADTVEFQFEDLVAGYLEDYELHGYRAIKSARSRVAQLGRRFARSPASAIPLRPFASTNSSGAGQVRRPGRSIVRRQPSAGCFDWPFVAGTSRRCRRSPIA
jgi:hypothetical protein